MCTLRPHRTLLAACHPRCLHLRSKLRIEREDAKAALDQANVDKRMLQLELAR